MIYTNGDYCGTSWKKYQLNRQDSNVDALGSCRNHNGKWLTDLQSLNNQYMFPVPDHSGDLTKEQSSIQMVQSCLVLEWRNIQMAPECHTKRVRYSNNHLNTSLVFKWSNPSIDPYNTEKWKFGI